MTAWSCSEKQQIKWACMIRLWKRILGYVTITGTLKLIPPYYRFSALQTDYDAMKDMLYDDIPDFERVMSAVKELEKEN